MKSGLGGRADKTKDDLEAAASAITFLRGEVRPVRLCPCALALFLNRKCAEAAVARADVTRRELRGSGGDRTGAAQVDLDARLPGAACADCEAFNCLVDTQLAEAVRYSTWCEWASLSQLPARTPRHAQVLLYT